MANTTSLVHCSDNITENVTCSGSEHGDDVILWQDKTVSAIDLYVTLIISVLGWINNILAILVLQTKTYRGTSTGFLMTALACADFGVVSTSAARIWLYEFTIYVRLYTTTGCKCHMFFTYLFIHLSAWSLTLVTIERVVCVCNPLRVREIFNLKKTVIAWCFVAGVLIGANSNLLWTMDLYEFEEYGWICDLGLDYPFETFWKAWTIVDSILASAAPFAIILPCNVIIIVCMAKRSKTWRANTSSSGAQMSSTTIMLIVNSLAFVLLTAPSAVLLSWTAHGDITIDTPNMRLLYSVFLVFFNLNSCLNFVLYSVSSSKFRQAFRSLCERKTKHHKANMLSKNKNATVSSTSTKGSSISKTNSTSMN